MSESANSLAAALALMPEHVCPYGGTHLRVGGPCGEDGWLCHRCREDRADARVARLTGPLNDIAGWLEQIVLDDRERNRP